ncbi:hypothetical protein HC891_19630 [Candidatus Gracilibacteria bacterium]|nr:hypothetical protein [Candidatus Gracilibacteria bacterium]
MLSASAALAAPEAAKAAQNLMAAQVEVRVGATEVDFGVFGFGGDGNGLKELQENLVKTLREFSTKLNDTMQQAIDNAATLEVKTYVADAVEDVRFSDEEVVGGQLRALTRVALDGDTQVVVPTRGDVLDEQLWEIHRSMVQQALTNRAEMVRAITAAAAGLFSAIAGK